MEERLAIIEKLNKTPLQMHALKLMKKDREQIDENELYLVQVARQITENYYAQNYIRKNLMLLVYDRLLEDLFDICEMEPNEQIEMMTNPVGYGSAEDLMQCNELYEMALVIMQTLIDKREARDGAAYDYK